MKSSNKSSTKKEIKTTDPAKYTGWLTYVVGFRSAVAGSDPISAPLESFDL